MNRKHERELGRFKDALVEMEPKRKRGRFSTTDSAVAAGRFEISDHHLALAVRGDIMITPSMFELTIKGKNRDNRQRQHLTPRGQIVSAVRKVLSNISAADFGKVLLTDLSKDSFLKAEILLGACRVASFRRFHEQVEQHTEHTVTNGSGACLAIGDSCTGVHAGLPSGPSLPPAIAVHSYSVFVNISVYRFAWCSFLKSSESSSDSSEVLES